MKKEFNRIVLLNIALFSVLLVFLGIVILSDKPIDAKDLNGRWYSELGGELRVLTFNASDMTYECSSNFVGVPSAGSFDVKKDKVLLTGEGEWNENPENAIVLHVVRTKSGYVTLEYPDDIVPVVFTMTKPKGSNKEQQNCTDDITDLPYDQIEVVAYDISYVLCASEWVSTTGHTVNFEPGKISIDGDEPAEFIMRHYATNSNDEYVVFVTIDNLSCTMFLKEKEFGTGYFDLRIVSNETDEPLFVGENIEQALHTSGL